MTQKDDREPIRVLLVIDNLEYGGAERQVIELANHLDRGRFEVHVCSLSDYVPLANQLIDAKTCFHIIQKRFRFDATVVPRLVRLLLRLKIAIVHGYLFDGNIAARLAGRLARTPAIVGSERNSDYDLKWRHTIVYWLTRSCVDVIIANSNAGAAFNRRKLGHHPSQYRVVHNGVDVRRFVPQDGQAVRRELGIEDDERVVGMFASFKQQKNHPLLFAAARLVLDALPRTRFLLVGDILERGRQGSAKYKERMGRLVDELGLRSRCLFLGNRADVVALYSACDITVLTSLFEGTPNVLLESMACGVPVVATDVSDNAYIVPNGRVGYIVALDDAIILADRICMLLSNESQRRAMGRAARDWVAQEFSITSLARKTENIYVEILNRSRRLRQSPAQLWLPSRSSVAEGGFGDDSGPAAERRTAAHYSKSPPGSGDGRRIDWGRRQDTLGLIRVFGTEPGAKANVDLRSTVP